MLRVPQDGSQLHHDSLERQQQSLPAAATISGSSVVKRSASERDGSDDNADHKARRVRKSTYSVRREEKELLLKEVEALERRAQVLRARSQGCLAEKQLLNTVMQEVRRGQQLSLAVTQSALSANMNADQSNPLNTHIRLSKDWSERRKTLMGMKDAKIRHAFEYAQARAKLLDPLKPHHAEERFENASGDYCCSRFDITQFEGVESVKQVFDTLLVYLLSIEISVSEQMGHITVREDYDTIEESVSNYRLLSTQFGVDVETHIVTFAKFFESHELSDGKPCGIVTFECVDEDELYPYSPGSKVRKDVAQTVVLTPHMRKKKKQQQQQQQQQQREGDSEEEDEGELVVVMTRGKFLKLHHNDELEIAPLAMQGLRSSMCWGPVMVTAINEFLHPEFVVPITQGKHLCA